MATLGYGVHETGKGHCPDEPAARTLAANLLAGIERLPECGGAGKRRE